MELYSFFGQQFSKYGHSFLFYEVCTTNNKSLFLQIHLLKLRHDIRMAAVMLQVILSFFAEYSEKRLYTSAKTYKKYFVCNDYCVAFHNDRTSFMSNCKFHIIILGNVDELLKKLDTFCFIYQHVDCLHTLFKHRFSGKIIAESGQVFDNVEDEQYFNEGKQGSGQNAEHCKKETLAEKSLKAFIQLLAGDKNNTD